MITTGYGYDMFTGTFGGHANLLPSRRQPGLPVLSGLDLLRQLLPAALEP
jgi:hypothetical protein